MDKSDVVFHVLKPWYRAEDPDFQQLTIKGPFTRG